MGGWHIGADIQQVKVMDTMGEGGKVKFEIFDHRFSYFLTRVEG